MKTYILRLELHDDLVSTRDKMGWAKDSRILLVWPEKTTLLNRRLDLILLQRHSRTLGSQLALVTRDPEVHYFAPRLGIPVFRSLHKAQGQHWRVPRRFRRFQEMAERPDLHRQEIKPSGVIPSRPAVANFNMPPLARLGVFFVGVLAVLALAASLAPSARLVLTPRTMVQDVLIDAWTGPDITSVNISGAVPSQLISVAVEGRDSLPASGTVRLPSQPAAGTVTFTNLTDGPVQIPLGSGVRGTAADIAHLRFVTTRAGEVPAGSGQTLQLPVRCVTPGPQGNLPAGALVAIEGLLGTQLSVSNPEPTSGGTDRLEPIPTQTDRHKLSERLHQALEKTALQEIQGQLDAGDLLIPGSLKLIKILDESYQPADILPSDQLVLSQRLEYQAQYVDAATLDSLAQTVFDANLPAGYSVLPDTLQLEVLTQPAADKSGVVRWSIHAVRQVQAQIPEAEAVQLTLGSKPVQAISRLQQSLPLEQPPRIELQPDWWPRLPFLPFRISVLNQGQENTGNSP
jgi:hypothetical protein